MTSVIGAFNLSPHSKEYNTLMNENLVDNNDFGS